MDVNLAPGCGPIGFCEDFVAHSSLEWPNRRLLASMGLLAVGSPLSWEQSQQYLQHVKKHGIAQFIATYRRLKDRSNDAL